jgi:hypothetical protein
MSSSDGSAGTRYGPRAELLRCCVFVRGNGYSHYRRPAPADYSLLLLMAPAEAATQSTRRRIRVTEFNKV